MYTNACKAINKAYTILRNIDSMEDLKKHKLSLCDYTAAKDIFKKLTTPGNTTKTFIKNVADFYEKCGFYVVPEGINFIIWTNKED